MKTFIDLFCGVGGFHVALSGMGLDCVFASDIDEKARRNYASNFGIKPEGDLTKIDAKSIPSHDVLCAGFPCQSFSAAGKQLAMKDTRGLLFFEIIRIAKYHRPKLMLLENVKNILSIDSGGVIDRIHKEITALGYSLFLHVLNAKYFGVAQDRVRVFFVAIRQNVLMRGWVTPPKHTTETMVIDIMDEESDRKFLTRRPVFFDGIRVRKQHSLIAIGKHSTGFADVIYSVYGVSPTLLKSRQCVYSRFPGDRIFYLTNVETKRLAGFPDDHVATWDQLGNAVVPNVVRDLYQSIQPR